jgi:hypothetical protein
VSECKTVGVSELQSIILQYLMSDCKIARVSKLQIVRESE